MFVTVLWQPLPDKHDAFVTWLSDDFIPGMLESPEVLRTRIFTLQHASAFADGKAATKSTQGMYQYMTMWEFESEELPWEIMVLLGSSEMWRYYVDGGHLQWQIAQYVAGRIYPEEGNVEDVEAKRVDSGKGLDDGKGKWKARQEEED
jgi:hypothetical protein